MKLPETGEIWGDVEIMAVGFDPAFCRVVVVYCANDEDDFSPYVMHLDQFVQKYQFSS